MSTERTPLSDQPIKSQIESLKQELAAGIEALKAEYDGKIKLLLQEEERKAALDLARNDSILMQDEVTRAVIQNGGKTADGRIIENLGDFLADRRAVLEKNPGLNYGPKRKWDDLPPDAKGTAHSEE